MVSRGKRYNARARTTLRASGPITFRVSSFVLLSSPVSTPQVLHYKLPTNSETGTHIGDLDLATRPPHAAGFLRVRLVN